MLAIIFTVCLILLNPSELAADSNTMGFCQNGLEFANFEEFNQFIVVFKEKTERQLVQERWPPACVKDREAILDLESFVTREKVCDFIVIEGMINYHKKYLQKRFFSFEAKPITAKFFTRLAIQVAYTCKKNLLKNLESAKEELNARGQVFEQAREKVYNDEPGIVANIKLLEEQPDDPISANIKPKTQAEITLAEYREALTKLRKPEDVLTFEREECEKSKHRYTSVSKDKLDLFFKPALMCHQLSRYYAGSVLSIARLANHGYVAVHEELDAAFEESLLLKDWLIAVQVCEPMLYMQTRSIEDDWATVDTCSLRVAAIEQAVYDDTLEELDNGTLAVMIRKSESSRKNAQKLMKSAMKKLAKADILRQLKSGASKRSIFSKSLNFLKGEGKVNPASSSANTEALGAFTIVLTGEVSHVISPGGKGGVSVHEELSDEESYKLLTQTMSERPQAGNNDIDTPVSFDPVSSMITSIIVMAIMLSFEWLFFIVMTVAARLCHKLHFNFENLLTFPPKSLSWADADFSRFSDKIDKYDEDDFFDFEELNPDEQEQRRVLAKVFGKAPPMLYRD